MRSLARLVRLAAAAALLAAPQAGWTVFDPVNDDTDIFLANPSFTASRPNVLIFIDNTANWNTAFSIEKSALISVINGLTDSYNVGTMMFVETGSPNDNVDGAYVRFGIRQMTATNKTALAGQISGLDILNDKGNNATMSLAMGEAYRYFAGVDSYSGIGKVKRDYAGNTAYNAASASLPGNPFISAASQTYVSPISDGCQKNFIIVISNGNFGDNSSSLGIAQTHLAGLVGKNPPDTITVTPNGEQGIWADEYAKFFANSDCNASFAGTQNIYTYTLDVLPKATGQGPSHTAMLQSMATNGKGKYFAITDVSNTTQLTVALNSIFQEVQAVNSVFASTTLPVSVNVRGTNLNQVYIGVFRPDSNKSPRWLGNLKLYKLGVDTATQSLFLADANTTACPTQGCPAENASTGFISANAQSYWTTASTFWSFRDPSVNGVGGSSDKPDGDQVEKGGAAQQLRIAYPGPLVASPDNTARKLYTCTNVTSVGTCATTGLSSTPFDNTNVTAADLGTFTTKSVVSITSAGTTATATVTAHGWSTGDVVKITGATPDVYNTKPTASITVVDANTFTYTLPSTPDATRARFTATNHGLNNGDLLYFFDYDSYVACGYCYPYPGYTGYFVPVTRVDANHFDYSPATPQTTPKTTDSGYPPLYGYGGNIPAFAVGALGSGTIIVSYPGHGLSTGTFSYLYPTPSFPYPTPWYYGYGNITVTDANTLELPTYKSFYDANYALLYPCPGCYDAINAPADIALVTTSTDHTYQTGQTITIKGSGTAAFNGAKVITRIDARRFYFVETTQTVASTTAGMAAGFPITSIAHPTSGSPSAQDVATVTTSPAHLFAAGNAPQITGTGAAFNTVTACTGYDVGTGLNQVASWTVQSISGATFTITNGNISSCPGSFTSATKPNMFVGYPIAKIEPARLQLNNMAVLHQFTGTLISPLTSASGTILAGRPIDADTTQRDALIAWVRSADNKDNENLNGISNDVRASVHGDVLHSRPATINYNRYGDDNDIYAYYGSNDGVLHSVKGGIAAHTSGPDTSLKPGSERWGFVPKEFFGKLKRLRDQTPTISNINQKDYFFDGSIGVYQKDAKGNGNAASPLNCVPGACPGSPAPDTVSGVIGDNVHPTAGDKVNLYLSMRRGGNFMYSLDVLNPASPKLLWRKGNGDDGWNTLGQTWSEPKISRSSASLANSNNPDDVVVIIGAGYDDAVEDYNPCLLAEWYTDRVVPKLVGTGTVTYTATGSCVITGSSGTDTAVSRKVGNGLMVIDAITGTVFWQASAKPDGKATYNLTVPDMTCAIPSDVTVLDKDRNGFADRLYVGDTCGNVWRADISDPDPKNWSVTLIATLANGSGDPKDMSDKIKFLFPPDLVFGQDASGNYTAVLLGSGDREHPFDATVTNSFFMIKDRDFKGLLGAPNSSTVSIASSADGSLDKPMIKKQLFDATNQFVDNSQTESLSGWFIDMRAGEKVVGSAVTISGTTFFNTNQPSSTAGGGSCNSNLGIAREYLVGFADASATTDLNGLGTLSIANRSTIHAGGGYLPSPVPVVVEIDGKKYQAVISGTSVQTPPGLTLEKRTRAFWYKQID